MSRVQKRLMAGALTIIAVGGIAWAAMAPAPEDRKPTTLPAFELELLGQNGTLSSADLRGHPAVINFWASWCGPCNREAPALESTWRRYEDEGVLFLGIDVRDIESQAEAFLEKHDITYPSVRDPDQILVEAMKIGDPLPQTFFIDAAGKIQTGSGLGEISAKELETQIELLLDLAPAPAES